MRAGRRTKGTDFRQVELLSNAFHAKTVTEFLFNRIIRNLKRVIMFVFVQELEQENLSDVHALTIK